MATEILAKSVTEGLGNQDRFKVCHKDGDALLKDFENLSKEMMAKVGAPDMTAAQRLEYLASPQIVSRFEALVDRLVKIDIAVLKCTANSQSICPPSGTKYPKSPVEEISKVLAAYTKPAHKLIVWWYSMMEEYAKECDNVSDMRQLARIYTKATGMLNWGGSEKTTGVADIIEGFSGTGSGLIPSNPWRTSTLVLALVAGGLAGYLWHVKRL
jgi:hypothetical protein